MTQNPRTEHPPEPPELRNLDELAEYLRQLRSWAGGMSYVALADRVNAQRDRHAKPVGQTTVYDCFRAGRKRMDMALVLDIAATMGLSDDALGRLKQAIRGMLGDVKAAAAIDIHPSVPEPSATFTGRESELKQIAALLRSAGQPGRRPVIALTGPGGAGKTELALHAAHRLLANGRCSDAQLFANLHGFDLERAPSSPVTVLAGLLKRLGLREEQLSAHRSVESLAALFRSTMAGKRAILVLDNAASPDHIRHLLPGSATCVVFITSRRRFRDFDAGASLSVGAMNEDEALELLQRYDTTDRVRAEPDAARRLAVELCSRMPLDLVALGGQLANPAEASWSLADHAARLASFPRDEVERPAISASYNSLPTAAQRVFRMLAVHPGHDFTCYDAAALTDTTLAEARETCALLADHHLLLHQQAIDRFRFHDAIHAFAHRLLMANEPASGQRIALRRLHHHHRHTATLAMDHFAPQDKSARPTEPAPETPVPGFTTDQDALDWLDAERRNLLTCAVRAADLGDLDHVGRLTTILYLYFDNRGHWREAMPMYRRACRAPGGRDRIAALLSLALAAFRMGEYGDAIERCQRAVDIARDIGDRSTEANSLGNLGIICEHIGRFDKALGYYQQALSIARAEGKRTSEASALINLANTHIRLGRHRLAIDCVERALPICEEYGDRPGRCHALNSLGTAHARLDELDEAMRCYDEALAISRGVGNRVDEAVTISAIAVVHTELGRYDIAAEHHERALAILRDNGIRHREPAVLNDLGTTMRLSGRPDTAHEHHTTALDLSVSIGRRYDAAKARQGLAELAAERGDLETATDHWRQAHDAFSEMGVLEAVDVARRLARPPAAPATGSSAPPQCRELEGTYVHRRR